MQKVVFQKLFVLPVGVFLFIGGCGRKPAELSEVLSKDGSFIPGPGFAWGDSKEQVLEKLPHRECLTPGNKAFEAFRNTESGKGYSTLFAVDTLTFQGIDKPFKVLYEFERDTGLYCVHYDLEVSHLEAGLQVLRQLLPLLYELYPESSMGDSSYLRRFETEAFSEEGVNFIDWQGEDGTVLRLMTFLLEYGETDGRKCYISLQTGMPTDQ